MYVPSWRPCKAPRSAVAPPPPPPPPPPGPGPPPPPRRRTGSGAVEPGTVRPGEHGRASQLGVSRHTIRHALGVLAAEGLLRRQRGRGGGTRVLGPTDSRPVIERSLG